MGVTIPLTKGKVAIVDEADAEKVGAYKWYVSTVSPTLLYASRKDWQGGRAREVLMHRLITGAGPGQVVDHINGDTLDNRRSNLRLTDVQHNSWNRASQRGSRSQYRGVSVWGGKFYVRIFLEGRNQYLGCYSDERLAARVFDYAAAKHHGEYARLNLPDEPLTEAEFVELTKRRKAHSDYRGVSWSKGKSKWVAHIGVKSVQKFLGYFTDETAAARAYNEAAVKYHGDKAVLNQV